MGQAEHQHSTESGFFVLAFPTAPHPSPPMGRRGTSDDGAAAAPSPPHWGGEGRGEVGNATAPQAHRST